MLKNDKFSLTKSRFREINILVNFREIDDLFFPRFCYTSDAKQQCTVLRTKKMSLILSYFKNVLGWRLVRNLAYSVNTFLRRKLDLFSTVIFSAFFSLQITLLQGNNSISYSKHTFT